MRGAPRLSIEGLGRKGQASQLPIDRLPRPRDVQVPISEMMARTTHRTVNSLQIYRYVQSKNLFQGAEDCCS